MGCELISAISAPRWIIVYPEFPKWSFRPYLRLFCGLAGHAGGDIDDCCPEQQQGVDLAIFQIIEEQKIRIGHACAGVSASFPISLIR
jgi:hypothetical protein